MAPLKATAFDEASLMHNAVHLPELSEYLYLGNWEAGADKEFAKQSKIGYVVRCCSEDALGAEWPKSHQHTTRTCSPLPIGDMDASEVPTPEEYQAWKEAVESCVKTITHAIEKGKKVLVHDLGGERRAAAVCVAWAAIHLGWSVSRAVKVVGKWSKKAGRKVLDGGKHPLVELVNRLLCERSVADSSGPSSTGIKRDMSEFSIVGSKRAKIEHQCPFAAQAQMVNNALIDDERYLPEVPLEVRCMLAAGIPNGLLVPSDERHEIQATIVKRIGDVLSEVAAGFVAKAAGTRRAVETEISKQKAGEEERDRLVLAVAQADAAISAARSAVEVAEGEVNSAEANELQAVSAQKGSQTAIEKLDHQRTMCEDAQNGAFASLARGEWSHTDLVELKSCLVELGAEESLLMGVAPALGKKPEDRSEFDLMVVQSIEKFLAQKKSDIERDVSVHRGTLSESVSGAQAASAVLESARKHYAEADTRLNEAVTAWTDELTRQSLAEDALEATTPAISEKSALQERADQTVKDFQLVLDAFNFLKVRKSAVPAEESVVSNPQENMLPSVMPDCGTEISVHTNEVCDETPCEV